jgi:hypothetical protein
VGWRSQSEEGSRAAWIPAAVEVPEAAGSVGRLKRTAMAGSGAMEARMEAAVGAPLPHRHTKEMVGTRGS